MRRAVPRFAFALGLAAVVILGAALRFYDLPQRPLHHDEGVNALFTLRLINEGLYRYDPQNYHGPVLYYLSRLPLSLFGLEDSPLFWPREGAAEIAFRTMPALLGSLLLVWVVPLRSWLGRAGAAAAMLLLAVSPCFVYFSRDNIHEIYLLAFTLGTLAAGYKFSCSRRPGYLYLAACGLALMFATKETALLTLGVWIASLLLCTGIHGFLETREKGSGGAWAGRLLRGWFPAHTPAALAGTTALLFLLGSLFLALGRAPLPGWAHAAGRYLLAAAWLGVFSRLFPATRHRPAHVWGAIFLCLALIATLFSSLLSYPKGVALFFTAFEKWAQTGTVHSAHTKPFIYFIDIMTRYEKPILGFGLLGAVFSFRRHEPLTTFVICWCAILLLLYSAIPYKTPWLVLNLLLPLALLAGRFVQTFLEAYRALPWRVLLAVVTLVSAGKAAGLAARIAYQEYDQETHAIVYVQSKREILDLIGKIRFLAEGLEGPATRIEVVSPDYWPLPWYLRDYRQVFWHGKMIPAPQAPLIIARRDQEKDLERRLGRRHYQKARFALRPAVTLTLYHRPAEAGRRPFPHLAPVLVADSPGRRLKPGLMKVVRRGGGFRGPVIAREPAEAVDFAYARNRDKPYASPFSITWVGYLFVPQSGVYTLITESDDGSWIALDGVPIVDNGGEHGLQRASGRAHLERGYHRIRIRYFDRHFGAIMRLRWIPPGQEETSLGRGSLFHAPAGETWEKR